MTEKWPGYDWLKTLYNWGAIQPNLEWYVPKFLTEDEYKSICGHDFPVTTTTTIPATTSTSIDAVITSTTEKLTTTSTTVKPEITTTTEKPMTTSTTPETAKAPESTTTTIDNK